MSRGPGRGGKGKAKPDPAAEAFAEGLKLAMRNPALAALEPTVCRGKECRQYPERGLCRIDSGGALHAHPTRRAEPAEWAWAIAHCVIHLGFGHVPAATGERVQPDRADLAARCAVVNRFQETFPCGQPPDDLPASWPGGDEEQIAAGWRRDGVPVAYERCGTGGDAPDQVLTSWPDDQFTPPPTDWQEAFARALTRSVSVAMDVAGGRRMSFSDEAPHVREWHHALNWFVSSYPLLGGIAAGMRIVADAELARAHDIAIAAVNATAGEIYINPLVRLTTEEWRFVLAHEMLHAALRHGDRLGGRDPYLFNVAADYVINGWLREMDVGLMPDGLLHDPELAGLSAEEVYDRIAGDLRRMRRLSTLRGKGRGDILGEPLARGPPTTSTSTSSTGAVWSRASTCTGTRNAAPCPPDSWRRSGRSAIHRCPGTPGWPAGSTSSCPGPSRCAPSPARPAARRPPRTSRARGAGSRPRRSPAAPSVWSSTPRVRWTGSCSARRSARSPRTPPPGTSPPRGWCSATRPRTTRGTSPSRTSPAGSGSGPRRHSPATGGRSAAPGRRLPGERAPADHHRRLVRCADRAP